RRGQARVLCASCLASVEKALSMTVPALQATTGRPPSDAAPPRAAPPPAPAAAARQAPQSERFPPEPRTLEQTGLEATDVEGLVLKLLLTSGPTVGRRIAEQIRLPFGLVAEQLRTLKAQGLVNYSNQATMGDFEYDLITEG